MNEASNKKPYSRANLNFIPGAAAGWLRKKLTSGFHGSPGIAMLVAGISILVGSYVGYMISSLARNQLTKRLSSHIAVVGVKIFVPAFITITCIAIAVTASAAGTNQATQKQGIKSALDHGQTLTRTVIQNAEGLTDQDITMSLLSSWASTLLLQGIHKARETCLKQGGSEAKCNTINSSETHSIVHVPGRNIGLIHFRVYIGTTTLYNAARLIGIKGTKMISVSCLRAGAAPVSLHDVTCASEVYKTFGVRLSGQ